MINQITGDLLDVKEGYIVHGCNAQGVMNSGVAKQIRERYPENYLVYKVSITQKKLNFESPLGHIIKYRIGDLMIINAITQDRYGRDGKQYVNYDAVRDCFRKINEVVLKTDDLPKIVNFPLIGCGLGGGDWDIISKIIDDELDDSIEKNLITPGW